MHDLDVRKKSTSLNVHEFWCWLGEVWIGISNNSLLPNEWSYWPLQPLSSKIFSRPFQRLYCFYVYLNIKMRNIAKQIYCLLPLLLFFYLVEKLVPYKNRLFFQKRTSRTFFLFFWHLLDIIEPIFEEIGEGSCLVCIGFHLHAVCKLP